MEGRTFGKNLYLPKKNDLPRSAEVVGDSTVIVTARRLRSPRLTGPACPPLTLPSEVRMMVTFWSEVRRQHGFLVEATIVPAPVLTIIGVVTKCTNNFVNSQCQIAKHGFEPASVVFASLFSRTSGRDGHISVWAKLVLHCRQAVALELAVAAGGCWTVPPTDTARRSGSLVCRPNPWKYHQDWRQPSCAPCHVGAGVFAVTGSTSATVEAISVMSEDEKSHRSPTPTRLSFSDCGDRQQTPGHRRCPRCPAS